MCIRDSNLEPRAGIELMHRQSHHRVAFSGGEPQSVVEAEVWTAADGSAFMPSPMERMLTQWFESETSKKLLGSSPSVEKPVRKGAEITGSRGAGKDKDSTVSSDLAMLCVATSCQR